MISSIINVHLTDLQMPLNVITVAVNHLQQTYVSSGYDSFHWYVCLKGHGELILNQQKYTITPNVGCLIFEHTPFTFNALSEDWRMDLLEFDGVLCREILRVLGFTDSGVYHFFDDITTFHSYLNKILKMTKKNPLPDKEAFSKVCYALLMDMPKSITHIQRGTVIDEAIRNHQIVLKVISYLENHYAEPITLDDISREVELTKGYICHLFKETMGITVVRELTYIRIGRARIFLTQYPEKNVTEIAGMCGFDSAGYFGKVFKKINGVTPDQYRRKKACNGTESGVELRE